ncbi:MAG: VanZ family protein [Candidatus Ancillula sp.]|jgi:glycopeptide antibiotics resistance protein|nr:VanZ family protein [Candidatus Ancillula sp.]
MLAYLSNFSASFKMALIIWPFVGVLLTIPMLTFHYIKYHRLPLIRVGVSYLFILYAIGIFFAFTLYPFPEDFQVACSSMVEKVQLIPFYMAVSILHDTGRAILQVLLNLVFFLPLGVFLRNFWGRKIGTSIGIILASSLLVEALQLTHMFGILPCQYRLFDVDDLIVNTLGGILGFMLAKYLPDLSKAQKFFENEPNKAPGPIQRFVTFYAEYLISVVLCSLIAIGHAMVFTDMHTSRALYLSLLTATLLLGEFALPLLYKGFTPLSLFTNSTLDDKRRSKARRFAFYSVRFAVLWMIFVFPQGAIAVPVSLLVALPIVIAYPFIKKPLYALI